MSDGTQRVYATLGILVAVMVFFIIMLGVTFGVFGVDGVGTVMIVAGILVVLIIAFLVFVGIVKLIASIYGNATSHIINFQAADDRGEVERLRITRELMRSDREYDKDVRRLAVPVARQLARQLPVAKQVEPDDFYRLPVYDDGNTIDCEG